ncbi:hypothetical protein D3C87_1425420 [compost metagenome]
MNDQFYFLSSQKKTTNHILHLLLCIPTFGLWLIVWFFVASSNQGHNKKIDKQINQIMHYKSQGLSDTDTYRQIKSDKLTSDVIQGRVIFVVLVVVFLYFYLR